MSSENKKREIDVVYDLQKLNSIDTVDLIEKLISDKDFDQNNAFYIADLDEVYHRHVQWKKYFPRIEPLYAVKNNDDCKVIRLLKYLGVGFECSSLNEIENLVKANIPSNKLLFGNPIKSSSHIKYCHDIGVKQLVFDNENELIKIRDNHPSAQCLLRIQVASMPVKFGAFIDASKNLIEKCILWKMNLIGISFYVGFRQQNANNIISAIKDSRYLFDYAREKFGYLMSCLDIGGGFPGTWQSKDVFISMAKNINNVLDEYFPVEYFRELNKNSERFYIISELGTYFTCSSYTLCVSIISKKDLPGIDLILENNPVNNGGNKIVVSGKKNELFHEMPDLEVTLNENTDNSKSTIYYINDSVYGSFKWYDFKDSLPIVHSLSDKKKVKKYVRSCIGGGTCDSGDFVLRNCLLPEMEIGDFFIFRNMGSYTKACAIDFCGIKLPETIYVSSSLWDTIKDAFVTVVGESNGVKTFAESNPKMSAKNILKDHLA